MTADRIAAEQNDVDREDNCANADAESVREPERFPHVVAEDENENEREIEEVAVHILQDQRERTLAPVGLARLAHGAGRRIGPERFVIRAAIIVTG